MQLDEEKVMMLKNIIDRLDGCDSASNFFRLRKEV